MIKCDYCGKVFNKSPSNRGKHNFCSTNCYHNYRNQIYKKKYNIQKKKLESDYGLNLENIKKLKQAGYNQKQICELIGCSRYCLIDYLKENGRNWINVEWNL